MEDAATVEISRAQVWQWIRNSVTLAEGPTVTAELVRQLLDQEMARLNQSADPQTQERLEAGRERFRSVFLFALYLP